MTEQHKQPCDCAACVWQEQKERIAADVLNRAFNSYSSPGRPLTRQQGETENDLYERAVFEAALVGRAYVRLTFVPPEIAFYGSSCADSIDDVAVLGYN